jgi:hypothetical protein
MGVGVEICTAGARTGAVFVGAGVGVVPTVVATGAQLTRKRNPMNKTPSLERNDCLVIAASPVLVYKLLPD